MNRFFKIISVLLAVMMLVSASWTVSFADEASTELVGIAVGNLSVENFDANTTEYVVPVPYKYKENDFETVDVPLVSAYAKDPNAEVTITQPADIEDTATIEVSNGGSVSTYTLTFEKANTNLVADGGMETDTWFTYNKKNINPSMAIEKSDEHVKGGTYSLKMTAGGWSRVVLGQPSHTANKAVSISPDVNYITTYYVSSPSSNNAYWFYQCFKNLSNVTKEFYLEDGTSKGTSDAIVNKLGSAWERSIMVFSSTSGNASTDPNGAMCFQPIPASNATFYMDEFYMAPLAVTDIVYTGKKAVVVPLEGTEEISLSAQLKNQLGGVHGLEDLTVEYSLMNTCKGVTLDGDTLTIDTTAEDCMALVNMEVTHNFDGTEKTISNIAPISIETLKASKAELLTISIGGLSIPGFEPMLKSYSFAVPYRYIPGDFETVEVPKVECVPADENAEINITYPDNADGGTIVIDVTCGDDNATYTIDLTTVGHNVYDDGGFETNAWVNSNNYRTDIDGNSVKLSSLMPKAGGSALSYTVPNGKMLYAPLTPSLTGGITYLRSLFVRQPDDGGIYMYNGSSGSDTSTHYNENGTLKSGDGVSGVTKNWMQLISTHYRNSTGQFMGSPFHYTSSNFTAEIDELFMAPMVVTGITYTGDDLNIAIPESADSDVSVTLGARMTNALGGVHGLENSKIVYGFADDYPGVKIDGNQLIVTQDAVDGPIVITMTADTSFKSVQGIIMNTAVAYLRTASKDAEIPKARYVTADRDKTADVYTVEGSYSYYHALGADEGDSVISWQYGSSSAGSFTDIPGANDLTYAVEDEYKDSYLRLAVTPVTSDGVSGPTYYSNVITPPTAPIAYNLYIEGEFAVDEELKGHYSYSDANGDNESGTTVGWYMSDTADGKFELIEGQTSDTYKIREEDIGKYISFRVKPSADTEPKTKDIYSTEAKLCASYPYATDVEIVKKADGVYAVSYKYNHPTNIGEGATKVEWLSGNDVIGTKNSITVSDNVSKLKVRVTPVAVKAPFEGEAVSETIEIKSKNSGGISRPSSGGGGGGFFVPIPEVKVEEVIPEPVKHWAEDGIAFCRNNAIMQDVAENDFGNAGIVTRAQLVSYIIKTLGEKESQYAHIFKDVKSTDYFAGALQKAVELGIISEAENFEPNRNVTRQEVCKILVAAYGNDISTEADLTKFIDNASISDWATDWVSRSVSIGLLKGVSDYEFNPLGSITREQTAVLLKRLSDLRNGGTIE